jgi:IS4 transposase
MRRLMMTNRRIEMSLKPRDAIRARKIKEAGFVVRRYRKGDVLDDHSERWAKWVVYEDCPSGSAVVGARSYVHGVNIAWRALQDM